MKQRKSDSQTRGIANKKAYLTGRGGRQISGSRKNLNDFQANDIQHQMQQAIHTQNQEILRQDSDELQIRSRESPMLLNRDS